jgi:hypothetical protein
MRQCHKRTLFVATDMLIFSALKYSKNGVCLYTISRLCLFQAVLLLAEHYTMHLTTVITALMRQCLKQTLFVATDMLIFGALKYSDNGKEEPILVSNAPELFSNESSIYCMRTTLTLQAAPYVCLFRMRLHV